MSSHRGNGHLTGSVLWEDVVIREGEGEEGGREGLSLTHINTGKERNGSVEL